MDISQMKDMSRFTVWVSNTEVLNQHNITEVTFDTCTNLYNPYSLLQQCNTNT